MRVWGFQASGTSRFIRVLNRDYFRTGTKAQYLVVGAFFAVKEQLTEERAVFSDEEPVLLLMHRA